MNAHDLAAAIADLDSRGAGDLSYRHLLSTAATYRRPFDTWRQKCLFVVGSKLVSQARATLGTPNWHLIPTELLPAVTECNPV